MSDEHQQHLRSQLKHVSMNNWNYTEYIPVVSHYLIDNYVLFYYFRYNIWSRLLVLSNFDRKNKESCQLGNVFRVICNEFAGRSCFVSVLKYFFTIKGLKSVYGIEQLDIGLFNASLASWSTTVLSWIPIWLAPNVKMTCLPIATSLL